jgi:hypothetical protein
MGVDAGNWVVPEREFVRGVAVLVKELWLPFLGACASGAKAPCHFVASYAALKRRSSTMLHASVVLDTSKPQGLKPDPNACP